ncbi:hypothetical protein Bca4012_017745 [Brassica carinata]
MSDLLNSQLFLYGINLAMITNSFHRRGAAGSFSPVLIHSDDREKNSRSRGRK